MLFHYQNSNTWWVGLNYLLLCMLITLLLSAWKGFAAALDEKDLGRGGSEGCISWRSLSVLTDDPWRKLSTRRGGKMERWGDGKRLIASSCTEAKHWPLRTGTLGRGNPHYDGSQAHDKMAAGNGHWPEADEPSPWVIVSLHHCNSGAPEGIGVLCGKSLVCTLMPFLPSLHCESAFNITVKDKTVIFFLIIMNLWQKKLF